MKRAAGYGRVSTIEQATKGTSSNDQEKRINEECVKRGLTLYNFYSDDGFSGKNMENRPGIQSLIRDAEEKKFEVVIFTKLDRAARNLRELLNFWDLLQEKHKLELICIDDTSVNMKGRFGKLNLQQLGMFAKFERDLIRERTSSGRKIKWENGEVFIGKPPYGYKWNRNKKKIEIIEKQRKIYEKIVSLYIDQHYSMIDIANKLNDEGISL